MAGFCDTATFIHMGGVFCAHVTGNFVLFAASIARGLKTEDYLKVLTFPVFVIGVILATYLIVRSMRGATRAFSTTLGTISALHWLAFLLSFTALHSVDVTITLILVVALGMQNTLHHFAPGPLTTVMTGTVMNTSANLTKKYLIRCESHEQQPQPLPGLGMMAAFLLGCTFGALGAFYGGFRCLVLPAAMSLWVAWSRARGESASRD